MKAEAYAKMFLEWMANVPPDVWEEDIDTSQYLSGPEQRLLKSALGICIELHKEVSTLIEQRKVKGDSARLGVLRELHQKWKAFVSRVPEYHLNNYFFRVYLQQKAPELSSLLEKHLV